VVVVRAEARFARGSAYHEEAEAQEGQVGRRALILFQRRGPILTRMKTLKTDKGICRTS